MISPSSHRTPYWFLDRIVNGKRPTSSWIANARLLSSSASVSFESRRCRVIPRDEDQCPGKVGSCTLAGDRSECLASGGSTFSHTFDIQRYANTNYFSDGGRGPQTNYYFSYIEPPDKWVDIIEPWNSKGAYRAATARKTLTMVPFWGLRPPRGSGSPPKGSGPLPVPSP
jgi:hypothetical protein